MNAGTWPGVSSVCCGPGSYPLRLVWPVRDAPRVRAQIVRVFSLGGIKDQRPRERLQYFAGRITRTAYATKARLAPLAVTHRYKRARCLWLEQFQIADSGG